MQKSSKNTWSRDTDRLEYRSYVYDIAYIVTVFRITQLIKGEYMASVHFKRSVNAGYPCLCHPRGSAVWNNSNIFHLPHFEWYKQHFIFIFNIPLMTRRPWQTPTIAASLEQTSTNMPVLKTKCGWGKTFLCAVQSMIILSVLSASVMLWSCFPVFAVI